MTGMDRWIDWSKSGFVGEAAARAEKAGKGPSKRLVTLEVEAIDADADGYEPVWSGGRKVGFITSGDYGHTVGKSLAMALVDSDVAGEGSKLTTHIVGVECPARVIAASPYDPDGRAMRG
jgi:dimethylglycine dehydrogenase